MVEKRSRSGSSLKKGLEYEIAVSNKLKELGYLVQEMTGGATKGHDIVFNKDDLKICLECKDKGAFEGGGKVLKPCEKGLGIVDNCLHKELLGDYIPFGGKVPEFLKGDKTLETWLKQKDDFKDEYLEMDKKTITKYYKNKGVHYIQIEGLGLYHTGLTTSTGQVSSVLDLAGLDILKLGCPEFECEIKMRIRCKRHTSSTMPSSVQAALIYKRKSIKKSSYDFMKAEAG